MGFPRSRFQFPQPWITLFIILVLFAGNLALALYIGLSISPSPLFQAVFAFAMASAVTTWVHFDSRSTGVSLGFDQGMFVFFTWPVTFPIYIFRSYGFRKGGLILLSFLGIYVVSMISAFFLIIIASVVGTVLSAR